MFEYMKNKLFILKDNVFDEKIQKIEDYLDKSPEGFNVKNLQAFKHMIQFVKELRKLKDLNAFFYSNLCN